jgi:hypothetical protein
MIKEYIRLSVLLQKLRDVLNDFGWTRMDPGRFNTPFTLIYGKRHLEQTFAF